MGWLPKRWRLKCRNPVARTGRGWCSDCANDGGTQSVCRVGFDKVRADADQRAGVGDAVKVLDLNRA